MDGNEHCSTRIEEVGQYECMGTKRWINSGGYVPRLPPEQDLRELRVQIPSFRVFSAGQRIGRLSRAYELDGDLIVENACDLHGLRRQCAPEGADFSEKVV